MQRKKIILLSAAFGAVIGAGATLRRGHFLASVPFFAIDRVLAGQEQFVVAALGWVVFSAYWEIAARNAAAAQRSESQASRRVHVFLANVSLMLVIAPIRGLGRFVPVSSLIMSGGLALEAAGLFLAIWARRHLGRNWSGEITIKVEHELIRSGPYGLLRHPIYTGILAMYAGTAVVTGQWLAAIGMALAALAYWRKIRLEEANLNQAFGAAYHSYRTETWALFPGLF